MWRVVDELPIDLMPTSTSSTASRSSSHRRREPRAREIGVIALVPDHWGTQWQSRHFMLTRLARYFQIVWVNPARPWREVVGELKSRRSGEPYRNLPSGFTVYDPGWLPKLYRPAWAGKWLFRQRLLGARKILTKKGCRQIVLYLWRPELQEALNLVDFDLSCYHIDDEYSFSEVDVPLAESEARLIEQVDQVFIHSPALLEKKGRINPRTRFVPNGVDYAMLAQVHPEPADLAAIPRPRIGYSGWVKKTLDWNLLEHLAKRHVNWSFVFVGQSKDDEQTRSAIALLSRYRNVHFLGAKSTSELAAYPGYFDVCIMPYSLTDYAKYGYPLKVHEYLAAGKPTVGARMRTLQDFESVVLLARTTDEWSAALLKALDDGMDSQTRRERRQAVARGHDWQILSAKVAATIRAALRQRQKK